MSTTHTITIEPLGRRVECREDQPILDACLRAGVWLPHACTHGTCGTCKAEVLEGEVDHGDASSFALMDFERDEGKALLCTARPRRDVEIEADVEEEEGVTYHPVQDLLATVASVEDVARDVRRVVLELDRDLAFNPGQYVQVHVPGAPAGTTRSYSIASAPSSPRRIELQIRRTPGGLATDGWVFAGLAAGDAVALAGPFGRFFYRERIDKPALLVAGGTGLAPLDAMVRHVLEGELDRRLILYQGARAVADLYDVERFRTLAAEHPDRFEYHPCVSEGDGNEDGVSVGHAPDVLARDRPSMAGHVAYVCGPPVMVEAAFKVFMKGRLFPRDIFREDFFDASDKASGAAVRSPLLRR